MSSQNFKKNFQHSKKPIVSNSKFATINDELKRNLAKYKKLYEELKAETDLRMMNLSLPTILSLQGEAVKKLEEKVEERKEMNKELKPKYKELYAHFEELSIRFDEAINDVNMLRKKPNELHKKIADLNSQIDTLREDSLKLTAENEQLKNRPRNSRQIPEAS
jgi:uncharacterized coiled-coil DUF342 family protein